MSLGVICTICYSYGGLSETAIKPLYRIYFMQVRSSTGLITENVSQLHLSNFVRYYLFFGCYNALLLLEYRLFISRHCATPLKIGGCYTVYSPVKSPVEASPAGPFKNPKDGERRRKSTKDAERRRITL